MVLIKHFRPGRAAAYAIVTCAARLRGAPSGAVGLGVSRGRRALYIGLGSKGMGSPEGKMERPYRRRLERLAGMAGGDEGFYVLALHSFVEAFGGERVPEARYEEMKFGDLTQRLAEILREPRSRAFAPGQGHRLGADESSATALRRETAAVRATSATPWCARSPRTRLVTSSW